MPPGCVPNVMLINELEVSLLAHILLEHFNARYSESDLLCALLNSDHNQVLPDSTSSVDEDHDVSSLSYNSDDNSDSDPLDYFLNNFYYGLYLVLTVLALLCVCNDIVFIVLYCGSYISIMLCILCAIWA